MLQAELADLRQRMIADTESFLCHEIPRRAEHRQPHLRGERRVSTLATKLRYDEGAAASESRPAGTAVPPPHGKRSQSSLLMPVIMKCSPHAPREVSYLTGSRSEPSMIAARPLGERPPHAEREDYTFNTAISPT